MRGGFIHCRAVDRRNYEFIVVILEVFHVRFSVRIYRRSDNGVGGRLGELFRGVLSFDSQLFQVFFGQ